VDQDPTDNDVTRGAARDAHRLRSGIIWTVALAALLTGVALAIPDLRDVLVRVADAGKGWIALAVVLEVASCLGYVVTVRLVLSRGPAREIRRLAWAELAFGAVVPLGGAGSLAAGAWAMRAWGVPWGRVANRSAVIFLLTSAVNAAVLALAGIGVAAGIGAGHAAWFYGLVAALIGLAAIGLVWSLPRWRAANADRLRGHRAEALLTRAAAWVSDTEKVALRPEPRLLGAIGYLLFDIAVMWVCLRAVGDNPPVLALVLGYQVGYLANLVPIPGAVGALDGGLLGALVLFGLPAAPTAAAIVLYHAIALSVPAIGGTVGFARLRRSFTAESPVSRSVARATASHALSGGAEPRHSTPVSTSTPITASTPAVNTLLQRSSQRPRI
jgi:uncharacterized membrane protein YbhN (UPF0104 family)